MTSQGFSETSLPACLPPTPSLETQRRQQPKIPRHDGGKKCGRMPLQLGRQAPGRSLLCPSLTTPLTSRGSLPSMPPDPRNNMCDIEPADDTFGLPNLPPPAAPAPPDHSFACEPPRPPPPLPFARGEERDLPDPSLMMSIFSRNFRLPRRVLYLFRCRISIGGGAGGGMIEVLFGAGGGESGNARVNYGRR